MNHGSIVMSQQALDDAAPIVVNGELLEVLHARVDDKGYLLPRDAFEYLLDDVVAVLVFDELQYLVLEFAGEGGLLIDKYMLESLDSGQRHVNA